MLLIGLKRSQPVGGFGIADSGLRIPSASLSIFSSPLFILFIIFVLPGCGAYALTNGAIRIGSTQGGSIRGRVVADIPEQRKPLAGVVMKLSSERRANTSLADKTIQAVSDLDGRYDFSGLIAGDYVISVELQGFKKYEQNILLQPLPLSETVTVTEDKTDTTKTESTAPGVITGMTPALPRSYRWFQCF